MYDADDVYLPLQKRGQVKGGYKDFRFLPESEFLKDVVSFERILGEELRSVNLMENWVVTQFEYVNLAFLIL